MAYNELISTITLVGSLLSFVATTCVLISYIVYREQQRSFRHALVLNLALAEFINSLNNSISGIITVKDHTLSPSPVCTLNGWVGQLSVQAADFSILAIALVTVLTITRKTYMPNASLGRKVMICMSVWVVPLITSSIAAGLQTMAPVSGNWCWISSQRTDLRYALGHGWRFAIMFITIGVYIYVWWYMRQHFQMMAGTQAKDSIDLNTTFNRPRASFATFSSNDLSKEKMGRQDSASTYDEELQLEYARMQKNHFVVDHSSLPGRPIQFPGYNETASFTFNVRDHSNVEPYREHEEVEEHVAPDVMRDDWPLRDDENMFLPTHEPHTSPTAPEPTPPPPPPRQPQPIHHHHHTYPSNPSADDPPFPLAAPPAPRTASTSTATSTHPLLPTHSLPTTTTTTTTPKTSPPSPPSPTISTFAAHQSQQVAREIRRMLLLNAYPVAWVLLWLPGMVNRLLEATGHRSETLAVLQSGSQYVGFANALTYGFNEHLRERIRGDVGRWFGRPRSRRDDWEARRV